MLRLVLLAFVLFLCCVAFTQENPALSVKVINEQQRPLSGVSLELLKPDSSLVKILLTDSLGEAIFPNLLLPSYLLRVSLKNYAPEFEFVRPGKEQWLVTLLPFDKAMEHVFIRGRKPFLEIKTDRTVVNVDAGVTNAGTNVLETLEKLPGVTLDRDGRISLRGRSGVTVFVDGKPTYLNGAELATYLEGLSAAQVAQIELIHTPPSSMDAAGNAGVINIKLKKSNQRGFNGTLTLTAAQGYYPKTNNSLQLNWRKGAVNLSANYAFNHFQGFNRVTAFRTYLKPDGTPGRLLDLESFQPGWRNAHNLRTAADVTLSKKSSLGFLITAAFQNRAATTTSDARWKSSSGDVDSLIQTVNKNRQDRKDLALSLNYRLQVSAASDFSVDVNRLHYGTDRFQTVDILGLTPTRYAENYRADVPTDITSYSAAADYNHQGKHSRYSAGVKSVYNATDNTSAYTFLANGIWIDDYGKSNHFKYDETIYAVYAQTQSTVNRWTLSGGLRLEATRYNGQQFGNPVTPAFFFSRQYTSLFPTASAAFERDSFNTFTLTLARRIDRPQFNQLNPFLFIINKYTYQQGNPFYRPQFTWNAELSHAYKNTVITTLSYAVSTDYFSQIFPEQRNNIILYTEGNLSRMQNFGAAVALQLTPTSWWSATGQANLNYKRFEGMIVQALQASVTQLTLNTNQQFRFAKTWSGEVNGSFVSASREDLQETRDPYGYVSLGLARNIAKGKGTLRFTVRDLFYTNRYEGVSEFVGARERSRLASDSRVATLSFVWRFGKAFKTLKHGDSASEESKRVSND